MTVGDLGIDALAQRCAEETEKFNRRQSSDEQYCWELLRRALAEDLSDAFTAVYRVYEGQVLRWIYSHRRFVHTDESAEYFAGGALRTFYFALRGPRFAQFGSLPQVLSYLKSCVHTAIAQYLRDQQPGPLLALDNIAEAGHSPDLGSANDAGELWAQICRLLPNPRDRLLARCVFVEDLKPRQIAVAYPGEWKDERDVSVALYRIRRILRNDPGLSARTDADAT